MRYRKPLSALPLRYRLNSFRFMASSLSQNPNVSVNEEDEQLCSEVLEQPLWPEDTLSLGRPNGYLSGESRIERAWAYWKKLGQPKFLVAPMVDNSELPFRMLCRNYGAQAAYTPMLHSRIFSENEKYRSQEFTTCKVPAYSDTHFVTSCL